MRRDLRPLLLPAAALLALAPASMRAASDDAPLIGGATGLSFSGYDKGDSGRREWTLAADRAAPAPGGVKNDWVLERVRIRTFDRTGGGEVASIVAPAARYEGATKTARDAGTVSVEGRGVRLAGRDWKWVNAGGVNTVTLGADVRVSILREGSDAAPVRISARTLVATMEATGMSLAFAGEVRVTQDATVVTCERLVTRVRGGAGDLGGKSGGRDAVERIDAEGGVRLESKGDIITGARAEIFPREQLYSILGDAEFTHLGDSRLRVTGDAMRYDRASGRIRVDPKADAADGRVEAELPCVDAARSKHSPGAEARARASGRRLEIIAGEEGNSLIFTGDVRLNDPDYAGSCESLTVETAIRGTEFRAVRNKADAVRRIVAENSVSLSNDGRTLRCARAEIVPAKNLVTLTGSPRAEDAKSGATAEADRMTLDTESRRLVATAAAERPVRVTLPALRKGESAPGARIGETAVESGILVATRREAQDTGIFEFEQGVTLTGDGLSGSCERLGVEVDTRRAGADRSADHRVRRIVAVGSVKLSQEAYFAEAGRAEIIPHAKLKELSVAEDNGMDGKNPFFVMLTTDESTPGLRPKIGLPSLRTPNLTAKGVAKANTGGPTPSPTLVTADRQELIHGGERLRAFARGDVVMEGRDFEGRAGSVEALATKSGGAFVADAVVAREGVEVRLGERRAHARNLEIFPRKNTLSLSGEPFIDGWASAPGVERKTLVWKSRPGANGGSGTDIELKDELREGLPQAIIRPRLVLPIESAPDLGRTLKRIDKGE